MAAAATNVSHEKGCAMIVVIRKGEKPPRRRAPGLRGHIAAIVGWWRRHRRCGVVLDHAPPQVESASACHTASS
jgi:hypothetical protein